MIIAIWLVIALSTVAMIAAGFSRNRVPVAVSVVIAAMLRVVFALMTSQRYTPRDVRDYFRETAELVLRGREPLQFMPGREWNFLELMPYVHALEFSSGLPWVYAVKIAPIVADLVLVWLVSLLAGRDGRTRALQYAVNPLSLLVVSLHGQVEPVALAFALGGIVLLKKERPVAAGILLGAAVAAKTWPIIILLAVLPLRQPRRAGQIVLGSTVVPAACLLSGVVFLGTNVRHALTRIVSYSGYVREWTWSGTYMTLFRHVGAGYDSKLSAPATILIVAGVATALWLFRRHPPEARALAALCAVLACTAGFGIQYLFWVLPLTIALAGAGRYWYAAMASGWAAIAYLLPFGTYATPVWLTGLSWLPASALVAVIVEQYRMPARIGTERRLVPALPASPYAPRPDMAAVPDRQLAASTHGRSDGQHRGRDPSVPG